MIQRQTRKLKTSPSSSSTVDKMMGMCLGELLSAAPALHRLHLKVTGEGSFAQHMALGELYEALPNLVDTVAEGYQGAAEVLLDIPSSPVNLPTVKSALEFIRKKTEAITKTQSMIPYSEVVNNMDLLKDALNTAKYKLIFLK
jgi:DNA-binding ferritin-like protein